MHVDVNLNLGETCVEIEIVQTPALYLLSFLVSVCVCLICKVTCLLRVPLHVVVYVFQLQPEPRFSFLSQHKHEEH